MQVAITHAVGGSMGALRSTFGMGSTLLLAGCTAIADSGTTNPPPPALTLTVVAGQDQVADWADTVPIRPAVQLKDAAGRAVAGATITFTTGPGTGSVTYATQVTGNDGVASAGVWSMGLPVGAKVLTASASGANPVQLMATAVEMSTVRKESGFDQSERAGTPVLDVPAIQVVTTNGTVPVPLIGATVTFVVTTGGGSLTEATTTTDRFGIARVGSWTLGPQPGTNRLSATVNYPGARAMPFTATGTP